MDKYIGTKVITAEPMQMGGKDGYKVKYSDGYESWSPKETFETCYRKSGAMTFGHALELMNKGYKMARNGWNGKNMFIFIADGKDLTRCMCSKGMPSCKDSICMLTADGEIVVGWLASQTDMLAEDWCVVE